MRRQFFKVSKHWSVANFLDYHTAKNYKNLITTNKVIAKTNRVPVFFLKHSVVLHSLHWTCSYLVFWHYYYFKINYIFIFNAKCTDLQTPGNDR